MRGLRLRFAALAGLLLTVGIVSQAIGETPAANRAANKVDSELDRYRGMLGSQDPFSNPGYLFVDRGAELWTKPAGPKNVALSTVCDLGKGAGKPDGAYAELPRYFADAGRVLELESRLLWCMVNLQGRDASEIVKTKF